MLRSSLPAVRRSLSTAAAGESSGGGGAGGGGGGFFRRVGAFLSGAGLSLGLSYGIIYSELREANDKLYSSIQGLEGRIKALEGASKK